MVKKYHLFFLICLSFACMDFMAQEKLAPKSQVQFLVADQFANTQLVHKIILAANHSFCYDLLADDKVLFHQPSKPGLQGNKGFKTKADAKKVANLIKTKIKNGEI